MKRYSLLVLCLVLCFSLSGCVSPFELFKNIGGLSITSQKEEDTQKPKEEEPSTSQDETKDDGISKPQENPYSYSQKLLLTTSYGSSNATMQLMNWENGNWESVYSCKATIGKNGAGSNYGEGKKITPTGIYKLGVILCKSEPGNNWPYRIVNTKTCIVDDTASQYYNTIQNADSIPKNISVDRIGETIINGNSEQCIYIEHNGNGLTSEGVVKGKGSAITICGKTTSLYATAGCVDISAYDLKNIISRMNYNNNPHIEIVIK